MALWRCTVCGVEYETLMTVKDVFVKHHKKMKCRGTMKKVED